MKLNEIKANPDNPRVLRDGKFAKLKQSLTDFPEMMDLRPIVVDENGIILGGNMRFRALQELYGKAGEIPDTWVKRADELTDEQKKEFIIKDNVAFGDWDFDALKGWDEPLDDWGVEIPEDFDDETEQTEAVEDEFDESEVKENICQSGDIWQLGEHRLMCGDSTKVDDVEKLMNGEKADLLFTDPPYGVSYENKTKEVLKSKNYTKIANDDLKLDDFKAFLFDIFKNAYISLKETASYYVFSCQGGDQEMMMMMMRECGIPCRHQVIWVKDAPVFSMGRLDYDYKHEPILYGWVKKHDFKRKGEQDKSVWEYKRTANKLHPTMKPIELIANALLNSTDKNNLVLDLFGGSGSTLIAAEQLWRKCYMMELDPHYCDVIIARWEKLTGKKAVKLQ